MEGPGPVKPQGPPVSLPAFEPAAVAAGPAVSSWLEPLVPGLWRSGLAAPQSSGPALYESVPSVPGKASVDPC